MWVGVMTDQLANPGHQEPTFSAARATVLRDEVVLAIEKAILMGGVSPGQRLVESDIARQMGISKAPVREALRQLEQLGLVVSHPRRGTFVIQITPTMASEAFSLRTLLETYAARLAIPLLDDRNFQQMDDLMARADIVLNVDHGQLVERDLEYHDILFEVSGHRLLQDAWSNLRAQIRLLLAASGVLRAANRRMGRVLTMAEAHAPITDALRARDVDRAEMAIVAHLAEGERRLLEKLAGNAAKPLVREEVFGRRVNHSHP
jgi:DNA-binding GntR family transcriptional regulator